MEDNKDLDNIDSNKSKYKYVSEIQQMMFVFGEKNEALEETAMLIEDIVRTQVIELLSSAAKLAAKRGLKTITPEDLIFLIRKDRAKVNRLRSFLAWKDVRKNTKESAGNEGVEDLLEDNQDKPQIKKMSIKLPWELISSLTNVLNSEDEEDQDTIEAFKDTQMRLKNADLITQQMSREEYVYYSECRQASFTYRKSKKFKDWCHMNSYIESKPNDDLIDIMGFLTFEMVGNLTELAIKIKLENNFKKEEANKKFDLNFNDKKEDAFLSIFDPPSGLQAPLQVEDVQEAFRFLQANRFRPLRNFEKGLCRTRVTLI